jgi:hypothetical protein
MMISVISSSITITDTCINTVNDTNFISVTDTLIINTSVTGINPPNNTNTIKIYPNPASTHVTINYGNYAIMNGYSLKIINSLGQQVFQKNCPSIDIETINPTLNGVRNMSYAIFIL